jgi:hypothetical protein
MDTIEPVLFHLCVSTLYRTHANSLTPFSSAGYMGDEVHLGLE